MVWTEGIYGEMRKRNMTREDVAELLEIHAASVTAKLNNKSEFKGSEIMKLSEALGIEDQKDTYFFRKQKE